MSEAQKAPKLPLRQIIVLSLCRFAEPIALTSVFPYLPEMIESFDVPEKEVSKWAGIASAVFSLSQAVTAVFWGRAADIFGRKIAILCAMLCVMTTSILFGFSQSLSWAIVARSLAGAGNGNVGIMRTVVAELVPQKELQPKAFSIMPLVWTIGSIFGPAFGGALANPARKYPKLFGSSTFLEKYPFALPNFVAAAIFLVGITIGVLFLKETLETKKDRPDFGRRLGDMLLGIFQRKKTNSWAHDDQSSSLLKHSRISSVSTLADEETREPQKAASAPVTYREVFTYQSSLNLLTYSLLALHSIAYDQLLPIFMHYPLQTDRSSNPDVSLPFKFTGGFGINSDRIGVIFVIYGIVGMFIQFFIFPSLAKHWGALKLLKTVSIIFPFTYVVTPFTALLPTQTLQQVGVMLVMLVKSFTSICAFPCTMILLTNSATALRILGTLNGVAVSLSALGRAGGPAICGWTFTMGVNIGYGILPWWTLAAFAVLAALPVWWLVEMEGFGSAADSDSDVEDTEEEADMPMDASGEGHASGTPFGGDPHNLTENDEDDGDFIVEREETEDPQPLSQTTSHGSMRPPSSSTHKRMTSPTGIKESAGPGGGRRLSNPLELSNNR